MGAPLHETSPLKVARGDVANNRDGYRQTISRILDTAIQIAILKRLENIETLLENKP